HHRARRDRWRPRSLRWHREPGIRGRFTVPDLARDAVKMSSIVVGTDLQAAARRNDRNPLVVDGRELVPNVTHAVSKRQHLYFYYELYDPALAPAIRGVTSPALFLGGPSAVARAPA